MKHIFTVLIILFLLCLGYGMWLYSESLRTGIEFEDLFKKDLSTKQATINNWSSSKD